MTDPMLYLSKRFGFVGFVLFHVALVAIPFTLIGLSFAFPEFGRVLAFVFIVLVSIGLLLMCIDIARDNYKDYMAQMRRMED